MAKTPILQFKNNITTNKPCNMTFTLYKHYNIKSIRLMLIFTTDVRGTHLFFAKIN